MRRRLVCLMLSVAVAFSFSFLFTIQADALSTGAKTLVKTKTVTIKPGKTYKMPAVKLNAKRAFQVPLTIKVSPKSKRDQITKGGYVLTLKNSKGKKLKSYKTKLRYVGQYSELAYVDWVYFYSKSIAKPGYAKGKYYFSIKNTSNCTIKVKYSVKGYTKFASNADFVKKKTVDYTAKKNDFKYLNGVFPYTYVGKIGPGLPVMSSIKSSNKKVYIDDWRITHTGKLYVYIDTNEKKADTVVSIKLKNKSKPYKVKFKVIGAN